MIGRIIQLDAEDDVSSIADRIEWACSQGRADRVALVVPANLERELDYARLQRLGQQFGVEIAIISPKLRQRLTARETGLVAFSNIDDVAHRKWMPSDEVEPVARLVPPRRFVPNSLARLFPKQHPVWVGLNLLVGVAALLVVLAAALMIAPTATISLTASSQSISQIVPVTLDVQATEANMETLTIPARRVDVIVEGDLATEATGKTDVVKYRSTGQVTFFNSLNAQTTVPRNTVVRTSSSSTPSRFTTLEDVVIPPHGQATASIESVDEGSIGNVGAKAINQVEGIASLYVKVSNPNGTGGGGGDTVRAVTKEDYARVRTDLRSKLFEQALQQMNSQTEIIGEGLFIVPDTFFIAEVQDETYDRFVSEAADSVTLHMRIQVAAVAVSPADLDAVARAALANKVPDGFSLLSAHAERGEVAEEGTGTRYEYYVVAKGLAGAEIDETRVRRIVRGQPIRDAQTALLNTFELKQNPVINVEPAWLGNLFKRMPFVTMRIETQVKRE